MAVQLVCSVPAALTPSVLLLFGSKGKKKIKKGKKNREMAFPRLISELNPASSQDTAARPRAPPRCSRAGLLHPGSPPAHPSQRSSRRATAPGSFRGPRALFSLFHSLALLSTAVSFSRLKDVLLFERWFASPRKKSSPGDSERASSCPKLGFRGTAGLSPKSHGVSEA